MSLPTDKIDWRRIASAAVWLAGAVAGAAYVSHRIADRGDEMASWLHFLMGCGVFAILAAPMIAVMLAPRGRLRMTEAVVLAPLLFLVAIAAVVLFPFQPFIDAFAKWLERRRNAREQRHRDSVDARGASTPADCGQSE